MLICTLLLATFRPAAAAPTPVSYPQVTLSNGQMTLTVYLPDAKNGYYRGMRFDWAGLISRVNYRGHTFYGPWQAPHDPRVEDAVIGPAEEFGMKQPLGYDEARPGQPFYKIGVGALRKSKAEKYVFFHPFAFAAPPTWTVTHGRTWMEFRQTLRGRRGWGYRYVKRLELAKDAPVFILTHRLENIGKRRIETTQYCHNFTMIDSEPIGLDYRVQFPFALHPRTPNSLGDTATITRGSINFTGPIPPGHSLYAEFPGPMQDCDLTVENRKTGAAVRVQGDHPVTEFHVYVVSSAVCPEPFIQISLAPGRWAVWHSRYTFQVTRSQK